MTWHRGTDDERSRERRNHMVALAREHANAEARGDLEATLATLESDCVYELQPVGRVFTGAENARRAYYALFTRFQPAVRGSVLRAQWITDEFLGQEYLVTLTEPDGSASVHSVVGLLTFGGDKLSGERIYASETFHRLAYGEAFEESSRWEGERSR